MLAHQMALESGLLQADCIEAMEFPDLAEKYAVSGVPHTSINGGVGVLVGAAPESYLVEQIKKALEEENKE